MRGRAGGRRGDRPAVLLLVLAVLGLHGLACASAPSGHGHPAGQAGAHAAAVAAGHPGAVDVRDGLLPAGLALVPAAHVAGAVQDTGADGAAVLGAACLLALVIGVLVRVAGGHRGPGRTPDDLRVARGPPWSGTLTRAPTLSSLGLLRL